MWTPTKQAKYGVALYNLDGKQVKKGLHLQIGETVQILEECGDWFRGFSTRNKSTKGIFPKTYVHIKECKVDVEGPEETISPVEDPVVSEVSYVLREWAIIWKKKYLERHMKLCRTMENVMLDLINCRRVLLSSTLTQDQCAQLKTRTVTIIDWGNRKLGLDLVPREDSEQVDAEKVGPVQLYLLHEESRQKSYQDCAAVINNSMRRKKKDSVPAIAVETYHLYMQFKALSSNIGEETEIVFSLYDAKTNRFFSEKFIVKLNKSGMPFHEDRQRQLATVFTDLGMKDMIRESYLIVHVLRIGSLRENESTKMPTTAYRRPYGCGVFYIRDILNEGPECTEERDVSVKLELCCENEFSTMHETMCRKQQNKSLLPTTQTSFNLSVGLRMFQGSLPDLKKEEPVTFMGVAVARKLGFPDIIMPGDVRNDLLLTLSRGEFERGSKKAQKNVEVRVLVIDAAGEVIKQCLKPGAGEPEVSEYNSFVYYHNNTPKWNDIITINIPTEINRCKGSHIRLELRHCSRNDRTEKKLFGFSFIRLVTIDGTTVCDGRHELQVYKCEDLRKLHTPSNYITLPSNTTEVNYAHGNAHGNSHFRLNEKEKFHVETLLCSTKLTQNADLLGLLKWKNNPDRVEENLDKLMHLEGEEIVKYLQDIMDALFNMFAFDNGSRIPQSQHVFKALVYIFNLLEDQKFEHFKPVMEAYINSHFSAVLVYRDLLVCLKEILEAVTAAITAPSVQVPFQRCFKVLGHIAKCIIQSRLLYIRALSGNQETSQFRSLVQDVFDVMAKTMSMESDVIIKTQSALLENIPKVMIEFNQVISCLDLSRYLCQLMNAMPRALDASAALFGVKLKCLRDIVNSALFADEESKGILLQLCIGQLKRHLVHRQEIGLCANILADILVSVHVDQAKNVACDDNVQMILSSLLEVVMSTTLDVIRDTTDIVAENLVACLLSMLKLMKEKQYKTVLEGYKDRKVLRDFIGRMLYLLTLLVKGMVFPRDWMVMRMATNSTILWAVSFLCQTINQRFLAGNDFDTQVWQSYFDLAVSFLTQDCLQLERFSGAKRQTILNKYGDMRVQMGYEILSMWDNLGDNKLQFVPSMVGAFLQVTLVPETELRKATLPIFFDMMECAQRAYGHFKQVESELIGSLDILISERKGDDEYKQLFNTVGRKEFRRLLGKVQSESAWQDNGTTFIQSVTKLLERLLDYRNVMEGDENVEKRMTCTVNLLNFYKSEIDKHDMYVRYIYKLKELHESAGNHTEAAFTVLLHAELLSWADPRQWDTKEALYREMIKCFDNGRTWEYGIPLCKELAKHYEDKIQYNKLSNILQKQAHFYDKILREQRLEPEYFKVGFFGQGFPLFLRNKDFVYRGIECERLAAFSERLLSEFSGARLLTSNLPPQDDVRNGHGQHIQVCHVKPLPDISPEFLASDVPDSVRDFYKVNMIDTFQYDRPFHRGEKDEINEHKTLHIERLTMRIATKLPGILRWFEIVESQAVVLDPIEVAIDRMEQMNQELRTHVSRHTPASRSHDVRTLTMRLHGVIDAAVNGGISKYQDAFFSQAYIAENPQNGQYVTRLKELYLDQLQVLDQGLRIHRQLVTPDVQELHNRMEDLFDKMRQGIRESGSPNMSRFELEVSQSLGDKRGSQNSYSSASPAYTPTPPGSNRSSGVYSELDNPRDSSLSLSDTNSVAGFGASVQLQSALITSVECGSRRRSSTPIGINRMASNAVPRPYSAIYPTSDLSSPQASERSKKCIEMVETKVSSESNLEVRGSTPSLASAISSVSLDSGIGHGSLGFSQTHRRSQTTGPSGRSPMREPSIQEMRELPPALPPRRPSLPGEDLGHRSSSPARTSRSMDKRVHVLSKQISETSVLEITDSREFANVVGDIQRLTSETSVLPLPSGASLTSETSVAPSPSRVSLTPTQAARAQYLAATPVSRPASCVSLTNKPPVPPKHPPSVSMGTSLDMQRNPLGGTVCSPSMGTPMSPAPFSPRSRGKQGPFSPRHNNSRENFDFETARPVQSSPGQSNAATSPQVAPPVPARKPSVSLRREVKTMDIAQ